MNELKIKIYFDFCNKKKDLYSKFYNIKNYV